MVSDQCNNDPDFKIFIFNNNWFMSCNNKFCDNKKLMSVKNAIS